MSYFLESERLYLKPVAPTDAGDFFAMHSDPEVMRYLGGVRENETLEFLEERLKLMHAYYEKCPGLGLWTAREKATHAFIGWFALKHLDQYEEIEVGYRLRQASWGKGYATEMAKRLLDYGFNTLKLPEIVAITDIENKRSQRVLEKIGLSRAPHRHDSYFGFPASVVNFYRITP